MLRAGHAYRQRETDLVAYTSANGARYLSRCSKEMDSAGDIQERLIDRHPLDTRGEVGKNRHDIITELLVAVEAAADEQEIPAELAGPPAWHAAADAVAPGFVRCRQHHAAADGDRPVPQRGVQELLDRRVEGVEVGMQDRRPPDWRKFHPAQISRTDVRFPGELSPRGFRPLACRRWR